MTAAPAISKTRIDDTPLDDLVRERAIYDTAIKAALDKGQRPHPLLYDAILVYDAVICARLRAIEGEESSLGKRLPDTPNLKEEAA